MSEAMNEEFLAKYSALLVRVWTDDTELQRLLGDPTAYAAEAGLPIESGATVVVDRNNPEELFSKATLLGDWAATDGRHTLHVPADSLLDVQELTDTELDAVAGGTDININFYQAD